MSLSQSMIDRPAQSDIPTALQLLTELRDLQPRPQSVSHSPCSHERYILFFDGGSRGNPGPGGAGAVVVATDTHGATASIVWAAAMSYASKDMTNNRAEYLGVIAGLRAAHHNQWVPLDVVGDSALILRQLKEYRAPKNRQLRPLYAQARVYADKVGVKHWLHHFRAHNKMADAAANIAMDARASAQVAYPTTRPDFQGLQQHLAGDFQQWAAATNDRRQYQGQGRNDS